jgi:nucleoside 2-deoxyribosyltransferase
MVEENKTYKVYSAGGLFTQHELTTNVLIKKAIWEQSQGKFELVLPQSKELRHTDRPDIAAYIRNTDLLHVLKADIVLARFDGIELDSGTVVEFMLAKNLGKPTVILRCDSHRLGSDHMDEPYNLMVKNWPRTVEVHIDSLIQYSSVMQNVRDKHGRADSYEVRMDHELQTIQKGMQNLAGKVIDGFDRVLEMESPFPQEHRQLIYRLARLAPGSGFEDVLTEKMLDAIIEELKENGTL